MKQALEDLIEALETAINAGDWKVDGACDPTLALVRAKDALAQPKQWGASAVTHPEYIDEQKAKTQELRSMLAQPEQEPVAKAVSTAPERIWLDLGFDPTDEDDISFHDLVDTTWSEDNATGYGIEYVRADTTPPQRKPLSLHELSKIFASIPSIPFDGEWQLELVRAVEAAHGIKE